MHEKAQEPQNPGEQPGSRYVQVISFARNLKPRCRSESGSGFRSPLSASFVTFLQLHRCGNDSTAP